jgi:hypothetical protein
MSYGLELCSTHISEEQLKAIAHVLLYELAVSSTCLHFVLGYVILADGNDS